MSQVNQSSTTRSGVCVCSHSNGPQFRRTQRTSRGNRTFSWDGPSQIRRRTSRGVTAARHRGTGIHNTCPHGTARVATYIGIETRSSALDGRRDGGASKKLKVGTYYPMSRGGKRNRNFCEGTKKTTFYRADRTHTAPFPGTAGAVLLIRAIIHACQPSARARATPAGVPSVVTAQRPACTSACPQGRPNRRRSSRQR